MSSYRGQLACAAKKLRGRRLHRRRKLPPPINGPARRARQTPVTFDTIREAVVQRRHPNNSTGAARARPADTFAKDRYTRMSFSMTDGGARPGHQHHPTQAPARRAGHRCRDRGGLGGGGAPQRADPRAGRRTARPRTGSPRRTGRWGSWRNAREHYQAALALDPTNRIAERNISRLRMLLAEAGKKTVPAKPGSKAPVSASSWRRPARPASPTCSTWSSPRARPGQPG